MFLSGDILISPRKREKRKLLEIYLTLECNVQPNHSNAIVVVIRTRTVDQLKVQIGNTDISPRTVKITEAAHARHRYKVRPDQTTANFFGH